MLSHDRDCPRPKMNWASQNSDGGCWQENHQSNYNLLILDGTSSCFCVGPEENESSPLFFMSSAQLLQMHRLFLWNSIDKWKASSSSLFSQSSFDAVNSSCVVTFWSQADFLWTWRHHLLEEEGTREEQTAADMSEAVKLPLPGGQTLKEDLRGFCLVAQCNKNNNN